MPDCGRATRKEKEFGLAGETAVEQAARPGAFGRWLEGVSPNAVFGAVLGLVGASLAALVGGLFLMLNSQIESRFELMDFQMDSRFEIVHGRLDALDKKLLSIEEHLRNGGVSGGQRELPLRVRNVKPTKAAVRR